MSDATTMQAGQFCWNELMTSDVKKAKEFYSALFGWQMQDHDMGNMTYTMIKQGDKDIGGMMRTPPDKEGKIPAHWMGYVSVKDVDKSVEKAKSLGAKIIVDAMPVGDFGRMAVIQDPTGAHIAVWQSTKEC